MADAWIKIRCSLRRHPKVVQMASALKADKLRVVGALLAVWGVFDEHSVDGRLPGYSFDAMDEEIGWPGFSQAMSGIAWLERDNDCGLVMPRFQTHNGASAKRRAQDAERKRETRKDGGEKSASDADTLLSSLPAVEVPEREEARARKIGIPEDFALRDEDRDWAKKQGYGQFVDLHFAYFVDWANADPAKRRYVGVKGWRASFRNCVRADWGDVRRNAQRSGGGAASVPAAWRAGAEPEEVLKDAARKLQMEPWRTSETIGQFRTRIVDAGGEALLKPPRFKG